MQHCMQSFILNENAGKASVGVAELADSSAGCAHVQALAGEKGAKMLGESDRERTLYDSEPQSSTALVGKYSGEGFSRVFEKTRRGFQGPLKTTDLKV